MILGYSLLFSFLFTLENRNNNIQQPPPPQPHTFKPTHETPKRRTAMTTTTTTTVTYIRAYPWDQKAPKRRDYLRWCCGHRRPEGFPDGFFCYISSHPRPLRRPRTYRPLIRATERGKMVGKLIGWVSFSLSKTWAFRTNRMGNRWSTDTLNNETTIIPWERRVR